MLPEAFLDRMRALLGRDWPDFLEAMARPAFRGVRHNPLKCDPEVLAMSLGTPLYAAPFAPGLWYGALEHPGKTAAHRAGMFYSQEPSAAAPVTVLCPREGEKILDLCAAPGGKATQIAGAMLGTGLLWANETVRGRADALLSNLERLGVENAVVSSCRPEVLCRALQGYFDRVLVDAPCSGEGMFRREPESVGEWRPESPAACAQRQLKILDSAALAVREGGVLVYSTCTFSREENEDVAAAFCRAHSDFEQLPVPVFFGRAGLDGLSRRIYPMDGGEGQFMALFRRVGENPSSVGEFSGALPEKRCGAARALLDELFLDPPVRPLLRIDGGRWFLLPDVLPDLSGLHVLRAGVALGTERAGRIEPAHGLFAAAKKEACRRTVDFSPEDPLLAAFFRGEEIPCDAAGYTAVCVNGVPAGFGKASGGRLKNRYPKGLRG